VSGLGRDFGPDQSQTRVVPQIVFRDIIHMLQFFWLGTRKARANLGKHGTPWPPIPYEEIERLMAEERAQTLFRRLKATVLPTIL